MHHKLRTGIFKALELLPRKFGDELYHQLQRINEKSIQEEYNFQKSTILRFAEILNSTNISFSQRRVVEIGSGWLPILPYELIFSYQASEVLTFDINQHYFANRIADFNKFYKHQFNVTLTSTLPKEVKYFPRTNILDSAIHSGTVGAMVTRNVLEHISPDDLYSIHQQANSYLKDDGFIIHQISPSDHRAYSDQSLSLWDFLRYSQREWDRIQTRFDYHNRWRLPQYIEMFKACGFEIVFLSYKSAKKGQRLPAKIHADFEKYTTEEYTAGSIIVILKLKQK
ncbi:MAG TPA: methyltransferase domain-containing protein [Cyclobacteriaceae bacterium]|nr:methyltransferase domain-containing protein [Cyclobacteriaceae bacterium]HRJ83280.1 methyltransferase domain-containing protein [Cyclobacteriaceae bacterium]